MVSTELKRKQEPESGSSSDEEAIGPTLSLIKDKATAVVTKRKRKRIIKDLTINPRYVNSYMHKDQVLSIAKFELVLITGSKDGVIKFWNTLVDVKEGDDIESLQFIKQYQTNGPIIQLLVNPRDGIMYSINKSESTIRVFDMRSFDLINIIELKFESLKLSIAIFENKLRIVVVKDSHEFVIIDPEEGEVIDTVSDIHNSRIQTLDFNNRYGCMISSDLSGMIEYWIPGDGYKHPENVFESKIKTNLYDIRKSKSNVICLSLSSDEEKFLTLSIPDSKIRIFNFQTGKLLKEFEVEVNAESSAVFDESDIFITYSNHKGIHILNTIDGSSKVIGADEGLQFSKVLLMESRLDKMTVEMASSVSNEIIKKKLNKRSITTLVATSLEDQRFYVFNNDITRTNEEERDVYNEVPSKKLKNRTTSKGLIVTLHTNMGDIKIKLYRDQAPLAVENFVTLCSNGFYNNIIFHRIIPNFMIQTGDPTGTGSGGESIWGSTFKDEFNSDLRHFQYMVSMANAGPNTNGSQFFIVTSKEQLGHLDDKHTVFGKVVDGVDVVDEIEKVEVDEDDRPSGFTPKIVSTAVSK